MSESQRIQQSDLQPPGKTETIRCRSALVLAPHYDDEVLGCGGLLAQLADAGAKTRVLFLSDGSGGVEEVEDPEAYTARRRKEAARALEVLGFQGADYLDLPDGSLAGRQAELAHAISAALADHQPDLLLLPSPLEVTADHRTCFASLHQVASTLRSGDSLLETLESCRVLLYEVNHPAYPDVLVNVTSQLPVLEQAIRCYESQLERHDYLGAALGLRKYRALSLAPAVRAAEGYRSLMLGDFRTRSLAGVIRMLGGVPELLTVSQGPMVSVVVRTHNRPELAREALASIAASTYRRVEVVLVNDGGESPGMPEGYSLPVVEVNLAQNQGRATAANAGLEASSGEYLCFLDDDDLWEPEHLTTLVDLVSAPGVQIAYTDAAVGVYELGSRGGWQLVERRLPYSRDFDPDLLLLDNYIPFNTLLMPRDLVLKAGGFEPKLTFFEDWDFLIRLAALAPFAHLSQVTCEYRHFRQGGHHILGESPDKRDDFLTMKARVLARHQERMTPHILARAVAGLRQDVVEAQEARVAAAGELRKSRARWLVQEQEFHALRGENQALKGALGDLSQQKEKMDLELERLYGEEGRLNRTVADLLSDKDRLAARVADLEQGLLQRALRKIRG